MKKTEARKLKAKKIMPLLHKLYPDAQCELDHKNPIELLTAVILSAQCTDKRVNMVTPKLFKKYQTAKDYARAKPSELENLIKSTGFYKNKAKSIMGAFKAIEEHHGGKVPKNIEELVKLPGVGRKTANVILGVAYKIASGVVVDTHVKRITNRFGLTSRQDPVKIEQDLMEVLPKKEWIDYSHLVIFHGRRMCFARKPNCAECPLQKYCDYYQKEVA